MPEFARIAALAEIPDGEVRGYDLPGIRIAVAHLSGEIHALGDECPHGGCSLSEGSLDEDDGALVCPDDGSAFDLEMGEPVRGPALDPVPVFLTRVSDGWIEVAASAEL